MKKSEEEGVGAESRELQICRDIEKGKKTDVEMVRALWLMTDV